MSHDADPSHEFDSFDVAMSAILRAKPKVVKAAVDAEIQANTEARGAKR
jgi:hypothetical protein